MQADIHTLCTSDFYRILDFRCRCSDCSKSREEYTGSFCISFVRKGNFIFHTFRNEYDSYNGCILVTKPGYVHAVTHQHVVPDECTIIEFKQEFYEQALEHYGFKRSGFFNNDDQHSILLRTTAALEYLHASILAQLNGNRHSTMAIDNLVIELLESVVHGILDYRPVKNINTELKKNHLSTMERAKYYIASNYSNDISLAEIARFSLVSPFHFSRIFKTFTASTPHQYLLDQRLKHAELLLKNTSLPVNDISSSAGFNSPQHFSAAFSNRYRHSPARFRVRSSSEKSKIS